ncbi:lamin tail domain-containing protein, partial [Candidatus Woesearchaeota archaeon]|nr:lamin tail domain-containing protein [Candidatus Woesearchaeota archaeon]
MKTNKSSKFLTYVVILIALFSMVQSALGAVVINEVMYAPLGVDADHHWIEIYNNGPGTQSLAGFKLSEGGSDHGLTLKQGDIILAADGYGIIADNADQFLADYPGFTGTLFDSSFLLINTGETINLKDNTGNPVGTDLTYDSSWGGQDNGHSIEKVDSTIDDNTLSNWQEGNLGGTPGSSNNAAPLIISTPTTSVNQGTLYSYQIVASDDDQLSYTVTAPAWLKFDLNTLTISGTPTNAEVGDHVITIKVSDPANAEDEQTYTLTVVNENDAPTGADKTITLQEDTPYTFLATDFGFADIDQGDTLKSIKVTGLETKGALQLSGADVVLNQIISVADIAAGKFTFKPGSDEKGVSYANVQFLVSDGTEEAAAANIITFDVDAVNDAPTITSTPDQTATEGKSFSLTVIASDVDNTPAELFISSADSTLPKWLVIDGTDKLKLTGTPDTDGTFTIKIKVTDGNDPNANGLSAEDEFVITAKPALEILKNSISVDITGKTYGIKDKLEVRAGDTVKISYDYANNLDLIFGYVDIKAYSDWDPNLFTLHSGKKFSFLPGVGPETDSFEFTVPSVVPDTFIVTLDVSDEAEDGKSYGDSVPLLFAVKKDNEDLAIESVKLSDDTLTCIKSTDLELKLVNTGIKDIKPDIWVTNQAVAQFNNGEPVTTAALKKHFDINDLNIPTLKSGESTTLTLPLDASTLSGAQTLYVYVIHPFVTGFVADSTTVAVKDIKACLNKEKLEQFFSISKEDTASKNLFLLETDANGEYKYLNEEKGTIIDTKDITFKVPLNTPEETFQTHPEIIRCNVVNQNTAELQCTNIGQKAGSSEVSVAVVSAGGIEYTEKFTASVTGELEISSVQVNGKNSAADAVAVKPLEKLLVQFSLHNLLSEKLTPINVYLLDENGAADGYEFTFSDQEEFPSLDAGSEVSRSLTETIPGKIAPNDYQVVLVVEAKTLSGKALTEKKSIMLHVEPAPSEIMLKVTPGKTELTCEKEVDLKIVATNTGVATEQDVVISVKEGSEVLWSSAADGPIKIDGADQKFMESTYQKLVQLPITAAGKHMLTIEADYRFAGTEAGLHAAPVTIDVAKGSCLALISPADKNLLVGVGQKTSFEVTVPAGFSGNVLWFVDDEMVKTGIKYDLTVEKAGTYLVKAKINSEERAWTITAVDKPISAGLKTNLPADASPESLKGFKDFSLENALGKILFNEVVDLSTIFDMDKIISITEGTVALDSASASGLNKPATITLFKTFTNPKITKSTAFNSGPFASCPATECTIVSNANGQFVFTVPGFSTYKVEEVKPADFSISEVFLNDVQRGSTASVNVTITNTGGEKLTNLKAELTFDSKYQASISNLPAALDPGATATMELKVTVPTNEPSGKHTLGTLKVSADQVSSGKSSNVDLAVKSFLLIDSIKINGKTSGELSINEKNDIEVNVKNDYSKDMEEVIVTVTILDVDDDDLEEESDETDMGAGKDESFTAEFDLSKEKLDKAEYTIEVLVEGTAEDGSRHEITEKKSVSVDREKHQIIIRKAELTYPEVECTRDITLYATIENVGKDDEDDVELRLTNSALGLDERKTSIELDDYADDDNEHKAVFAVNVKDDATPGIYPLRLEVLREGDVEDSQELQLTVKDCLVLSKSAKQQTAYADAELAAQ